MLKKLLVLFIALSVGFTSTIDIRATVEDTTPPMVTGVEEGGIYKAPVTIGFDEGIAMLNEVEIANPTTVSELGEYVLVVTDQSNNVTTVHFSLVEAVAPVVLGVTNGASYTDPVTITFDEGTATLNGNAFVSGSLVSAHGAYTLVVTDEHDNVTTVNFGIVAKTAAVSGFKVVNAGYNAISLSWTAVSNVTGYEIWRSIGTSTTYGGLTTVYTNSFMNTGLAFNTRYNYKVRVFTLINNVKVYGAFSVIGSATTALTNPVTSVVSASYNSIRVSWAAVPGVSGYQVYRATSLAGTYTLLTSITATTYTNSLLTTNTLYYYKVRGYRTIGTLKYYSAYSTVLSARPIPSQVIGNSVVSSGYNSLKASWAAVSGATGYEVYKSSAVDGTYTLVLTTGLTSYSFTSLPTNVPLFVKVRAYRLVGTLKVYGAFSTIQSSSPIPSNPSVTLTSLSYKSLKLSWTAVSGATGYEVYHREGENYVLVQESSDLSLTVDGLVSGVTHDYKVIAYRMEGETKVYSKETLISGKALPSVPSVSSLVNYNTIKLKWYAVEGAVGYEIHRSATATGTFTLLSTVDVLEYNHLALAFNTSYFYKVRAYVVVNDVKVYGNFTGVLTVKTNVATPIVTVKSASYISATVSWAAVSGASGYEVSRATVLAGPYTVIVPATGLTSYTNSALTTNTLYYYRVRSYRLVGTVKYYSAYSTVVSVRPVPAVPTGVSLTSVGYDSARLGWVAVTGATGYEVFTSDSLDGAYTLKATTTSLSATISGLSTNVLVYAKVRAYRLVGTTKVYGDYSSIVNVAPIPAKPVVTVGNLSHTSIKVSWPMIAGADGYEVYHLVGSDYVLVQDNNELSLTVNELVSGEVHTYKVLAYRIVNDVRVYSLETIASGKAFPLTPVVTAAINYASIQLNWATVEGASGYEVVRSATSTGTYALLATVNTNTYLNSGLAFNTTYYYKVRAYALVNDVKVYGNYTGVLTYKTNVATPVVKAVSSSYVSTNVSWAAVSGASGYEVSRATVLAGPYTVIVPATGLTSYTNSALTTNTLYYYRVRSYRLVGTVKYYSAYSTVVSVRPVPAVPTGLALVSAGHDSVKATWTAVTGATGYEVYTSDAQDGTYALKATVTTNTATVSGYATEVLVYAKVRAYRLIGTTKVYGDFSTVNSGKPMVGKPVVTTTIINIFTMRLDWAAVAGASGYEIYWTAESVPFLLADVNTNTYLDEEMFPGDPYAYRIVAYKIVNDVRLYGESTVLSGTMLPPKPANLKFKWITQINVNLTWDAAYVDGFEVYKASSASGPFTLANTVTTNEGLVEGLAFNTTYYFKVRAYVELDTGKVFSEYSPVISGKTAITTPVVSISTQTNTSITLTWPSYQLVTGYEIYRATSLTGTYTLLKTQTSTTFVNTGLTTGTTYYYRVRAYRTIGTTKYYSGYGTISGKAAPMVPSEFYFEKISTTAIDLRWNLSTGASGYELSVATSLNGTYTILSSNANNYFSHTTLTLNQTYYYKVRAYVLSGTTKIYGNYTSVIFATAGAQTPKVAVIQEKDQDLNFYLTESLYGVNEVRIYEINPITQERTYITWISWDGERATTFYRGLVGVTKTFVAVSVANLNGQTVYSADSEIFTITLGHAEVENFRTGYVDGDSVTLYWNDIVNEVEIWRSTTFDGEYTLLTKGVYPQESFVDEAVELAQPYFYKIRTISVNPTTSESSYSEFSEPILAIPWLAEPSIAATVLAPDVIRVSWTSVAMADGFEVYMTPTGDYEDGIYLGDCLTNECLITDLLPNTTYKFFVVAYTLLEDGYIFSDPSNVATRTTPSYPKLTITPVNDYSGNKVTLNIFNTSEGSIYLSLFYVYAYLNTNGTEMPLVTVYNTSTQSVIQYTYINAGANMNLDFLINSDTLTFGPDTEITFKISYGGLVYSCYYHPVDGFTYFSDALLPYTQ